MGFPILRSPTRLAKITSTWGKDRSYRGGWHQGVDFVENFGANAYAVYDGTVVYIDNVDNSNAGKWFAIEHPGGITSRYMHMNDILVTKGQKVLQGQLVGKVGTTGTASSGPHIHFSIKVKENLLPQWQAQFGKPATGWGETSNMGVAVPVEPIMAGVTYDPATKAFSEKLGVKFYEFDWKELVWLGVAGAAIYRLYYS